MTVQRKMMCAMVATDLVISKETVPMLAHSMVGLETLTKNVTTAEKQVMKNGAVLHL